MNKENVMNLSNSKKKKMIMNLLPIINLILLILIENSCYALNHYDRQFSPLSDELITFINKQPNIEWKADRTTRFTSIHHAKSMMGVLLNSVDQHKLHRPIIHHNDINIKLPKYFDSQLFNRCGFGCNGGIPGMAWDYWKDEGIVTGGSNETHTGCQPYPFPECIHHSTSINHSSCEVKYYSTPECYQTCQPDYAIQYENDKYYGKNSYYVTSDEVSIMKEILLNGPVEATFYVFDDFLNYKTGVYKYVTGSLLGGHAIRIIGWGVSTLNHTPYWLCANSWNKQWGDKGYFKILRGSNECGIESMITAGLPK
ncbi:Cathepsin B-like cysteine proteinase [Schistosoma japonicum]|nr:Cathepsin B-like cysteine proteinase [Schistosoma japonicum]